MIYKNLKEQKKEAPKETIIEKLEILDCSSEKGKEKLNSLVRKIKAFSEKEDIFVDDLERFIVKAADRYYIDIQYIFHVNNEEGIFYSTSIINTKNHDRICTVYGKNLNELFSKAAIVIYYEIKNGLVERT